MLRGNVSRNGYGNVVVGRYGGCFEEDMGLCVGEQDEVLPRSWMHWRSMHLVSMRERELHIIEEARKYGRWKCQNQRLNNAFVYCKQLAVSTFHKWLNHPKRDHGGDTRSRWIPQP